MIVCSKKIPFYVEVVWLQCSVPPRAKSDLPKDLSGEASSKESLYADWSCKALKLLYHVSLFYEKKKML